MDISFIYANARGEISARTIEDAHEGEVYIQGYCTTAGALRTFRKDRVLEYLPDISAASGRIEHYRAAMPQPRATHQRIPMRRNFEKKMEICFTGFKSTDKQAMISAAEESGMFFVRTKVTRELDFLCCGPTAGPAKVQTARKQGVLILDSDQFAHLLETGEIPDNPT